MGSSLIFKRILVIGLLSLAGFPGTIGFYAKLIIRDRMFNFRGALLALLVITSTAFIYLYIRVFFPRIVRGKTDTGLKRHFTGGLSVFWAVFMSRPLAFIVRFLHRILKDLSFYYL